MFFLEFWEFGDLLGFFSGCVCDFCDFGGFGKNHKIQQEKKKDNIPKFPKIPPKKKCHNSQNYLFTCSDPLPQTFPNFLPACNLGARRRQVRRPSSSSAPSLASASIAPDAAHRLGRRWGRFLGQGELGCFGGGYGGVPFLLYKNQKSKSPTNPNLGCLLRRPAKSDSHLAV